MPRRRNTWMLIFLALLWFGATFVYFGDTGKYSDDWCASCRGVGGEIDWSNHPWKTWPYFWRPLHLLHVWALNTIFWRHEWVGHLELAVLHGAVCVMLYRLLVRLGSARGPGLAAALLFGTCPLLGEATCWYSASCNAIGSLLMLITLDLGCRFGSSPAPGPAERNESPPPAPGGGRGLSTVAILSFATACFYEPAAAGLATMPLVVWSASPPGARARRTTLATIAAGVPCALYAALLFASAPPGERGALARVGNLDSVQHSPHKIARSFLHATAGPEGRDVILGSVEQGLSAVREHPFLLGVVLATAIAGLVWLIASARTPALANPGANEPVLRPRGQLLLLGLMLTFVSLVPFIADHDKGLAPRSVYVPLLGVAILFAAAGNWACRFLRVLRGRSLAIASTTAAGAVGVLAIVGQIGLIGVQTQFLGIARHDAVVFGELRAMSPNVEPGSVFLILRDQHAGPATPRPEYNRLVHTALRDHWAATRFLRLSMRRADVRALTGNYTGRSPVLVDHLSSEGVRDVGVGSTGEFVPWTSIVPLWVDAHAQVHVVDALAVVPLAGTPLQVQAARAERLISSGASRFPKRVRLVELPGRKSRVLIDSDASPTAPGSDVGSPGTELEFAL